MSNEVDTDVENSEEGSSTKVDSDQESVISSASSDADGEQCHDTIIPTHHDDFKIAALIKYKHVLDIRRKRKEYKEYKIRYKEKMLQFLTSVSNKPFKTSGDVEINPMSFSVFEGLSKSQIPNIEDVRIIQQAIKRPTIFDKDGQLISKL
ncbi:endoglucanase H [Acrasis kona]|uniref:Endoglucanase H n=1 Tax=Acrasis kona TaxID=1008807 RepID=A0AAW2Z2B8_9EUKA